MTRSLLLLASAAAGVIFATGALAATPAWEFSATGSTGTNNTWDFGTNFTVNSTVTVTALGYYNDPNVGVVGNPVALYDSLGNLLAQTTVLPTDPQTGHFLYDAISPLVLGPGSYQIDGVSLSSNYAWDDFGFGTAAQITYSGNTWHVDTLPVFQNSVQNDVTDGYWGANFLIGSAAPEPSTWAMMVLGFAGLGFATYRRTKATERLALTVG